MMNISKSDIIGAVASGLVTIGLGIYSQVAMNNAIDEKFNEKLREQSGESEDENGEEA
jgi:hypothetical protein